MHQAGYGFSQQQRLNSLILRAGSPPPVESPQRRHVVFGQSKVKDLLNTPARSAQRRLLHELRLSAATVWCVHIYILYLRQELCPDLKVSGCSLKEEESLPWCSPGCDET